MMWLSVELSVGVVVNLGVIVSVGVMMSQWNHGGNRSNSLNIAFKAEQELCKNFPGQIYSV